MPFEPVKMSLLNLLCTLPLSTIAAALIVGGVSALRGN